MRAAVRVADRMRDEVMQYDNEYSSRGNPQKRPFQYSKKVEEKVPADSANDYSGRREEVYNQRALG